MHGSTLTALRCFLKFSPQPDRPGRQDSPPSKRPNPSVPRRRINFTLNDPQRRRGRTGRRTWGADGEKFVSWSAGWNQIRNESQKRYTTLL